jgi:FemAB-related protein (PEP-CTERM system-associated)
VQPGLSIDLKHSSPAFTPASSGRIEIDHLEPGEEDQWDRFVTACPSGTFFHLHGWQRVVEDVIGHRCFFLVARRDNRITGAFPLGWVRSRIFGDCLTSVPLAVYGGICADDQESYFSLLQAGSEMAERLGVQYLELRNRTEPFPTSLPGRDLYVGFTQDLSAGPEKLMKGLPRDTRYAIRKSENAGLKWVEDLRMDEFYELYARNVHRLGTPVFPKRLFESFKRAFPKQCRLFAVRKGSKAIAGVFCFYFRKEVIPYYSGSLLEHYRECPNNFMYWNLMDQSWREGYRSFDFGRSKRGTGSCKFKSSWNMRVTELPYRYKLFRAKEVPPMSPIDPKFRTAVALWKRLPFPLTKVLGPILIKRVPSA